MAKIIRALRSGTVMTDLPQINKRDPQVVLQLRRQGKSLNQIAQALMDQGLYPLDRVKREPVRMRDETVRRLHLQAARRVVVRTRRLREAGLIPRGKPDRPKKQKH